MKSLKKILSLILTVGIICTMVVPTFADSTETTYGTGNLKGDCKILAHKDSAVKLKYELYDSTDVAATDVTYTLNSDDPAKDTWVILDSATGDLYISPKAKGKNFSITATGKDASGADISASVDIEVLNQYYFEDFEDETIGSTVTSNVFRSGSTAQVVANGSGKAALAEAATMFSYPLELNLPDGLTLSNYTVSGDYMIKLGDPKGTKSSYFTTADSYKTVSEYIFGIVKRNEDGTLKGTPETSNATNARMAIRISDVATDGANINHALTAIYYPGGTRWDGQKVSDVKFDTFMPFSVTITDGTGFSAKLAKNANGGTLSSYSPTLATDWSSIYSVGFGGYIDNIAMYSGTIATDAEFAAEYKIEGDENIARAPIGTTANVSYKLEPAMAGITVPASGVKWGLKTAYSGVSVNEDTGVVSIDGSVNAGTFTVVATLNGVAEAEKAVTIPAKVCSWSTIANAERLYHDFENQTVGTTLVTTTQSKQYDYAISINSFDKDLNGYAVAKADKEGNTYASALGRFVWSKDGANMYLSANINQLDEMTADKLTIEAEFMAETVNRHLGNNRWNLLMIPTAHDQATTDPVYLDLRYGWISDNLIGIYNYLNVDGNNRVDVAGSVAEPELIAVAKADEWFNMRIELNPTKQTYDVYVEDVLVLDDGKTLVPNIGGFLVGSAIDNFAIYSGSKQATVKTANDVYAYADGEKMSASLAQKINYAAAKDGSSFSAAIMESGDYAGAKIITALYSNTNKLIGIKYGEVEKSSAGISMGYSTVSGDVPEGGYAKIFIWNMDGITPVK